jgi:hypothetical protein
MPSNKHPLMVVSEPGLFAIVNSLLGASLVHRHVSRLFLLL